MGEGVDAIITGQSEIVHYEEYSKLPLGCMDL